jgi:hypothetical protein
MRFDICHKSSGLKNFRFTSPNQPQCKHPNRAFRHKVHTLRKADSMGYLGDKQEVHSYD